MSYFLKAGVAWRDISPKKGLPLGGYPHFPRHNTGIHDPLYASCIYLFDGQTEIVIAAMDILFFSKQYVAEVRKRVGHHCGIPEKNIMISCAHTHSGPWAAGGVDGETLCDNEDADYVNGLIGKLADMMAEAKENAFDAQLAVSKGTCGPEQGIGGNRRDPKGPADTDVCLMAVKDLNDVVRGLYVNYALHPTVIHEDSDVVSADFPGYTRLYFKDRYPKAALVYAQGCSGNQSSRYFRQGQSFEEAKRIGDEIGKAAVHTIENMAYMSEVKLDVKWAELPIKTRDLPSVEQLKKQAEETGRVYQTLKAQDASYIDVQNANLKHLGAEDLLSFTVANQTGAFRLLNEENPAEVQVIRLGDACIVGLPGEVFVEFALDIKSRSPFAHTFVTSIANGCLPGYVCTKEAYAAGGYEAGASFLDAEFGHDLVRKAMELIKETTA